MYQERFYHNWIKDGDLKPFRVIVKETDLFIRADKNLQRKALKYVIKYRKVLESYISKYPLFLTSLTPLKNDDKAPALVSRMIEATALAGVGPMASVAGAMADFVGNDLLQYSDEVIVENGGDIFIKAKKNRYAGIYAGDSPYTGRIALEIPANKTPLGICTSSGTVGHSLSFGKADAVTIISKTACIADAFATRIGNLVKKESDISRCIEEAGKIKEITGLLIIKEKKLGIWGDIKLVKV